MQNTQIQSGNIHSSVVDHLFQGLASRVVEELFKSGGFTYLSAYNTTSNRPELGYSVGVRNLLIEYEVIDSLETETLVKNELANAHAGQYNIGGWLDGTTLYIDKIALFKNEDDARQKCIELGELAYYDFSKKEAIYV